MSERVAGRGGGGCLRFLEGDMGEGGACSPKQNPHRMRFSSTMRPPTTSSSSALLSLEPPPPGAFSCSSAVTDADLWAWAATLAGPAAGVVRCEK